MVTTDIPPITHPTLSIHGYGYYPTLRTHPIPNLNPSRSNGMGYPMSFRPVITRWSEFWFKFNSEIIYRLSSMKIKADVFNRRSGTFLKNRRHFQWQTMLRKKFKIQSLTFVPINDESSSINDESSPTTINGAIRATYVEDERTQKKTQRLRHQSTKFDYFFIRNECHRRPSFFQY